MMSSLGALSQPVSVAIALLRRAVISCLGAVAVSSCSRATAALRLFEGSRRHAAGAVWAGASCLHICPGSNNPNTRAAEAVIRGGLALLSGPQAIFKQNLLA